jgi:hypothetical protein
VVDDEGLLCRVISWKDIAGEVPERQVGQVFVETVDPSTNP